MLNLNFSLHMIPQTIRVFVFRSSYSLVLFIAAKIAIIIDMCIKNKVGKFIYLHRGK